MQQDGAVMDRENVFIVDLLPMIADPLGQNTKTCYPALFWSGEHGSVAGPFSNLIQSPCTMNASLYTCSMVHVYHDDCRLVLPSFAPYVPA